METLFPIVSLTKTELVFSLFHFGEKKILDDVSSSQMSSWRPVSMREFLCFAKNFPSVYQEFPVVGVGVSVEFPDSRYVGCLGWSKPVKKNPSLLMVPVASLVPDNFSFFWPEQCRFLVVKKEP